MSKRQRKMMNLKPKAKLLLESTGALDEGLFLMRLSLVVRGAVRGFVYVRSGWYQAQNLRVAEESKRGSLEPVPEAVYYLGDPQDTKTDRVGWAGGVDNFNKLWPSIKSSWWVGLHIKDRKSDRAFIGIHLDAGSPGTAGCIGVRRSDERKVVGWFKRYDLEKIVVNWGLGTVDDILISSKDEGWQALDTAIIRGQGWVRARDFAKATKSKIRFNPKNKKVEVAIPV